MNPAAVLRVLVQAKGIHETARKLGSLQGDLHKARAAADDNDRAMRRLGGSSGSLGDKLKGLRGGFRDTDRDGNKLSVTLGKLTDRLFATNSGFTFSRNVMGLLKWPSLIAGAGIAAQALSAAAAGAVAFGAALAPAAGALAAYPAVASAAAQALVTFKLATMGVDDALKPITDRLAKPSAAAKEFADRIAPLAGRIVGLRNAAQGPILDALARGAERLSGLFPTLRTGVSRTAGVIAGLVDQAARLASSKGFGRDLETQMGRNAVTIDRLGRTGLNLADALRHVVIAAGPLVGWFTRLAVRWSQGAKAAAEQGRQTGALAGFFEKTRAVLARLFSIAGSVATALFNIGKAGAPLGRELLAAIDANAKRFAEWTASADGKNKVALFFKRARAPLFELGRLIRDVTKAFFQMGQGKQVAPLLRQVRTELLPVLEDVVDSTTKAFGPHLIRALTQVLRLMGALAGHSGPLIAFVDLLGLFAGALADLLTHNPALQSITITFLGFAAVLKAMQLTATVTGMKALGTVITGTAGAYRALAGGATVATVAQERGVVATVAAKVAMVASAAATRAYAAAQWLLNAAFLGFPVIAIVAALVAVGIGLVALWTKSETFRNVVIGAWQAVRDATVSVFEAIKNFLARWWPVLLGIFTGGVGTIVILVIRNWGKIKSTTTSVWNAIRDFIGRVWQSIRSTVSSAIGAVRSVITGGWNAIRSVTSSAWQRVKELVINPMAAARERVIEIVGGLLERIRNGLGKIVDAATTFAGNLKDKIVDAFKDAANRVVGFVNAIIGVVNKIPGVEIGKIKGFATGGVVGAEDAGPRSFSGQMLATGGKVMRPLAIVGEEAPKHPEYVIPTNPAYRGRALGLFGSLGRELNVPGFALGGVIGGLGDLAGGAIDVLAGGPSKLIDSLPNPADMLPGWLVGLGKHVIGKAGSFIKDKISSALSSIFGGDADMYKSVTEGPLRSFIAMVQRADQINAAGFPYVYGGGHGGFGGPYDCSGAVSAVLAAGGFLGSPITTDGLKVFGEAGDGKLVTIGVRGSTGRSAHTMMKLGNRYFESGSGHGAQWTSGWSGSFPIHRHPPGLAQGGVLGDTVEKLLDPSVVGWGLARGGTLPFVGSYHGGGIVPQEGLAHVQGGEQIGGPLVHIEHMDVHDGFDEQAMASRLAFLLETA